MSQSNNQNPPQGADSQETNNQNPPAPEAGGTGEAPSNTINGGPIESTALFETGENLDSKKPLEGHNPKVASKAEKKLTAKDLAAVGLAVDPASDGKLFGNQDTAKEFDLAELVPGLTELPDNKVTVCLQTFFKKPSGKEEEDKDLRKIQFIDPLTYAQYSKADADSGQSVYEQMAVRYTELHNPAK